MNLPIDARHATDQQDLLADMARQGLGNRREAAVVVCAGTSAAAWAVKIKSHVAYNVYAVRAVAIGEPGTTPVEIGDEIEAVNIAESFLNSGTLPAGMYALMSHVGDKNVFYALP